MLKKYTEIKQVKVIICFEKAFQFNMYVFVCFLCVPLQFQPGKCVGQQMSVDYKGDMYTASLTTGNIDPVSSSGKYITRATCNNNNNNEDYLYSAQSLKSSRRFTKSVTATLHYRSSTIKYMYKHIHSSCILMNQKKLKYKDGT